MEYDLIALGETMVALAAPPGESLRRADRWVVDHAGAESNTCVGLARLGLRVSWVSRLGHDAAGDRILDALAAEGVDTAWVGRDPYRPTGVMLKDPAAGVRYYRTGSAASVMGPEVLDGVPARQARAVLITGVTALIGAAPHAAGLAFLESAQRAREPARGRRRSDRRRRRLQRRLHRGAPAWRRGRRRASRRRALRRGGHDIYQRHRRVSADLRVTLTWEGLFAPTPSRRGAAVPPCAGVPRTRRGST
jgi:hypothetical protein